MAQAKNIKSPQWKVKKWEKIGPKPIIQALNPIPSPFFPYNEALIEGAAMDYEMTVTTKAVNLGNPYATGPTATLSGTALPLSPYVPHFASNPNLSLEHMNDGPAQTPKKKTEEEKNDDLYDCPRGCPARLDFKDLQAHIQVGCDITPATGIGGGSLGRVEKHFHVVVAPYTNISTPFGNFTNPYNVGIEIIINKQV
jgi:hypothetical protein